MGEVYLAVQLGLGRFQKPLALKLLLPHLSESPQAIQMFLDEAQLAARMNHPNVVQIFDVGVAEGRHYIAMELVRGVSMSALIAALKTSNGRVSGALLAYIGRALCDGLHHAHELMDPDGKRLQVVHRDVTPHNVLLSNEGGVKLTDFGIAKARDSATHTRPGYVKGKFEYVAPEQLLGKPLDRRVDIFGAGLTLYHLATLGSPFRRENELATLHAIERDPLPSLALLRPDLPRSIREAITKATHKDPNARFPTARALRDALPPATSDARDELAELVRTLCGDAIAKLESKTADVKAMEGGTSSLEVEDAASEPGSVTGPPNWPPERVTSELSAMSANTASGDSPLPALTGRGTGGMAGPRDEPGLPAAVDDDDDGPAATVVNGRGPAAPRADLPGDDDFPDDDGPAATVVNGRSPVGNPATGVPPRARAQAPEDDAPSDEATGRLEDGGSDPESIPTRPPPPPLPAPARSLAAQAPVQRPVLGKPEAPSGRSNRTETSSHQAVPRPARNDVAQKTELQPAARPPRGDSVAPTPPLERPTKEVPEQAPRAPRREDRGVPSTLELTAEEREPTFTDVAAPRGPGAPVVAGGLLALMALGAFIAWRLGLGTPIEPPPTPAQRPSSRPAAVAPTVPAPKPQGETRPASGAAAPVARPAASVEGTGTAVVPAQVPTTGPEPGTGATQGPGQDRRADRVGFLTVDASPWANVYVDGKKLGQTPISREPLEEGLVPVLLMNPETGKSVSRKVRVTAGKTVYLKEDLR